MLEGNPALFIDVIKHLFTDLFFNLEQVAAASSGRDVRKQKLCISLQTTALGASETPSLGALLSHRVSV